MKNQLSILATVVFFLLCAFGKEWYQLLFPRTNASGQHIPDTVYVPKPYKVYVEVPVPSAPKIVTVYLPDTARRKKVEKEDLIGGMRITPTNLELEQLTPLGVSNVGEHKLPEHIKSIEIDSKGNVVITEDLEAARKAKNKEFWRGVWRTTKTVVLTTGAFIIGSKI